MVVGWTAATENSINGNYMATQPSLLFTHRSWPSFSGQTPSPPSLPFLRCRCSIVDAESSLPENLPPSPIFERLENQAADRPTLILFSILSFSLQPPSLPRVFLYPKQGCSTSSKGGLHLIPSGRQWKVLKNWQGYPRSPNCVSVGEGLGRGVRAFIPGAGSGWLPNLAES